MGTQVGIKIIAPVSPNIIDVSENGINMIAHQSCWCAFFLDASGIGIPEDKGNRHFLIPMHQKLYHGFTFPFVILLSMLKNKFTHENIYYV